MSVLLLVGSVVAVLQGNGADVAKHCVPAVTAPRISVTFRRMGDTFRQQVRSYEILELCRCHFVTVALWHCGNCHCATANPFRALHLALHLCAVSLRPRWLCFECVGSTLRRRDGGASG
eukprot:453366-Pyramimonas_sp.AAC.1